MSAAKSHLTLKMFLLILVTDIGDSVGQLLMKKGVAFTGNDYSHWSHILQFVSVNAASYLVWLGILIYVLNFLIWIVVLSRVDMSIAIPTGCINYIIVAFLSLIFLHETVSLLRWAGILLIVMGINVLAKSPQTVEESMER